MSTDDGETWRNLRGRVEDEMVNDGRWQPAFGPLLDEYVEALQAAGALRAEANLQPFSKAKSGRSYAHPGFALADREVRRAALLLMRVESLAGPGSPEVDEEPDPFAEVDAWQLSEKQDTEAIRSPVQDERKGARYV